MYQLNVERETVRVYQLSERLIKWTKKNEELGGYKKNYSDLEEERNKLLEVIFKTKDRLEKEKSHMKL